MCVCEGGEGRLGCGFILLYSIFYLTSILLVPSLCTIFYILLLVFYHLWPQSYVLYSILYLVSTIFNTVYVPSIYMPQCYVLDSKFCILYILHNLTSILLLPSLCTIFDILLLVFHHLWPQSYMIFDIVSLSTIFNIVYVHSMYILCLRF